MEFPDRTGPAGRLSECPRPKAIVDLRSKGSATAAVTETENRVFLDSHVCGWSARLSRQGHPGIGQTPDALRSTGLGEVVA